MILTLTPAGLRAGRRTIPCTVGRGGVVRRKREGDGGTPAGVHRIVGMAFRADRVARPAPWAAPIGPRDLWCDDPGSVHYNHLTRLPFSGSAERMRRADRLYDLVLLTDWNWPNAVPGRGSAIFLHRWRGVGVRTEGCVAMAPSDLLWLCRRVAPGARLAVPEGLAGRL